MRDLTLTAAPLWRRRSGVIGAVLALVLISVAVNPVQAYAGTAQTITFSNPGPQNYGTAPTLSASASSGLTVSFSSTSTAICTITSGGALTFTNGGTCSITASQDGDATYDAATPVTQSFAVNAVVPGAPTIGVATAGDTSADVTFTAPAANGGAAITGYTATSNPGGATGTCTTSPCTVSGLTNGVAYTFTVTATNSAGTGSASAASNSITPEATQTITFTNPGAQNFGTTPTLTASASSGLTPTFTSSTTGVCTITSGGSLTFVTSGTCTIQADQAGNSAYQPAPQVAQSFSVAAVVPGAPSITSLTDGDTEVTVAFSAPTSNGGATITGYTVTSNPGGITSSGCSASPCTVTGLTNGLSYTFTVTATNSTGTGSASPASASITPKATQTITFANPGAQNYGTRPTLTATSDSGLTPTFTSTTTSVCTITSAGTLTFVGGGTCTIQADQPGDGNYLAATPVARSFTVNAVVPTAPTIGTATAADQQASVTFTAPASNGGASIIGYTATSSPGGLTGTCPTSPCTITGLTNGTAYTFTVTATNSTGTGSASAASNAVTPKASQTITFANPGTQNYGTTPTLTATATSGLPVTFSSSTSAVCTVTAGGNLTFVSAGTCTIATDQAGNTAYLAAAPVSQTFTVAAVLPGAPIIGSAAGGDTTAAVSFAAPANDGGSPITGYTATANPGGLTGTCLASPCTVSGLTNGVSYTFTVSATTAIGTGDASAPSGSVTPIAAQSISFTLADTGTVGSTVTLTAIASSGLAVTLAVDASSTGGCAIAGTELTLSRVGTCIVNASQFGTAAFSPATSVQRTLTIYAAATAASSPSLDLSTSTAQTGGVITLTANGLLPGSTAKFWLHSDPVYLGSAVADPTGAASLTVTLPSGVSGAHQVEVQGTSASGTSVDLTQAITISTAVTGTDLASTGVAHLGSSLGLAAVLLLSGIAVAIAARRRSLRLWS